MATFYKRLSQIIDYYSFKSLNDFAINGLNYESSSKLNRLKDESKQPSVEIILDIANKFQEINIHWLVTGEGEMLIKKEISNYEANTKKDTAKIFEETKQVYLKQVETLEGQLKDKDTIIELLKEKIKTQ